MKTLFSIAKIETNGKIKATCKSISPEKDGYDISLSSNLLFHIHPEATKDLWDEFLEADLQNKIEILPPPEIKPLDLEDSLKNLEIQIQNKLDFFAKSWGYDSLISAASYSGSSNQKFKAEASALIGWRDRVWEWANFSLAQIKNGSAQIPSDLKSAVDLMPPPPERPV